VAARIALRTPEGQRVTGLRVLADGDEIWVSTPDGALRIDPQTNRVTKAISSPDKLQGSDFALSRDGLWARTADRRLLLFDPDTGAMRRSVGLALRQTGDAPLLETLGEGLVASVPGGLARVDPYTGRILWQRRLGQRLSGWTEAGGLIWARSSGGERDRHSALDPNTGRIMTSTEPDDYGGSGIAAIDDELLLSTVGGEVVIVRR
jgi:PQQ-like domain